MSQDQLSISEYDYNAQKLQDLSRQLKNMRMQGTIFTEARVKSQKHWRNVNVSKTHELNKLKERLVVSHFNANEIT